MKREELGLHHDQAVLIERDLAESDMVRMNRWFLENESYK